MCLILLRLLSSISWRGVTLLLMAGFLVSCSNTHAGQGIQALDVPRAHALDGAPHSLQSLKGEVVFLSFWATWCTQCVHELPALELLHKKFRNRGLKVLGIAIEDSAAAVRATTQKLGVTFPQWVDHESEFAGFFGIRGVPEVLILDRHGKPVPFRDPDSGETVDRISGYREWRSPSALRNIEEILSNH